MFGLFKSKEKKEFEKQLLLAQQGNAEAQYAVSAYYYNAIGTKQNLSEADKWLKESAKNGFGPAYYMQAQFLEENDENGSKAETVFTLYQKALDNGCTGACVPLGHMYLNGLGCEKSVEKAMKIYHVGLVAELKSDGDMNSFLNDLADVSEEMHTLCKKAQFGDGDAFYQLGVLLWHKQEYDLSYKFMVASAAFGDMNGVHELGRDYYYGYGVDVNMEVAEDLWTYAASHGNAAALRELGDLCTDREEYEQAYRYYLDSAKGGDDKGRIGVAECYLKGSGCEKNVPEAIKWLNRILEKNNAQPGFNWNTQWVQCAMLWLGGIYLGQEGDEFKNMNKAIATLKDGLELKDRFTTEISQILADIYGNKNGDYYNPQEAKKYQKIAEESQGIIGTDKVEKKKLEDGSIYTGEARLCQNGFYLPYGWGKKYVSKELELTGSWLDGNINGVCYINRHIAMLIGHFVDNRPDGWCLSYEQHKGFVFGVFKIDHCVKSLDQAVSWMTKRIWIGPQIKTSSEKKQILVGQIDNAMGFHFMNNGDVYVGKDNSKLDKTGYFFKFTHDGYIQIGRFENGNLVERMDPRNVLSANVVNPYQWDLLTEKIDTNKKYF